VGRGTVPGAHSPTSDRHADRARAAWLTAARPAARSTRASHRRPPLRQAAGTPARQPRPTASSTAYVMASGIGTGAILARGRSGAPMGRGGM
jgi:hypothetical protein